MGFADCAAIALIGQSTSQEQEFPADLLNELFVFLLTGGALHGGGVLLLLSILDRCTRVRRMLGFVELFVPKLF